VLTDVMNNGSQGTQGFIQVQAAQGIAWVETPSTPLLYAKGGRVYMEDLVD
jgi:hypothetical protein